MTDSSLDSKILGQLLIMQSVLNSLPNTKSIFSFVCKGLLDIPGVKNVVYTETRNREFENLPITESYPITLGDSFYGQLNITISDFDIFNPYKDYLHNFLFMTGVILEERNQRQINDEFLQLLEQRILERTLELNIEKNNLAESQRRFSDLMVNIKLLSVMLDTNGSIIFCNNYFLAITDYKADEVMGKNWFEMFLPKENAPKVKTVFKGVMNGKELTYNHEDEILTSGGEIRLISWNNTILRDANQQIIGTASIGEDITERKQAEIKLKEKNDEIEAQSEEYQQLNDTLRETIWELTCSNAKAEESDRLKTAFLQNMSHEIRTPMNAIMGFSNLLSDNFDNKPKLKLFTEIIRQRSSDLLDIINDILDIAKIESGQLSINMEETNLDDLFAELSTFLAEQQKELGKEHITLKLQSSCNSSQNIILTDRGKLKQIFINLIGNALKFIENGTIEFGCKMTNHQLQFYVADTGIGIAPDKQKIIFEHFMQLIPAENKLVSGTGLGLAIVKGLIDLLGGQLTLESEIGKGSTFSFSISYKTVQPRLKKTLNTEQPINWPTTNKTILIIEDDYFNAEYLKEILSNTGLNILYSKYGKEAIHIASTQPIDLVLMDIRLPDINGYDATQQIKKIKPELTIIAQTAHASDEDRQKALDAGCNDYISKPTKRELLINMIGKHLAVTKC